MADGYRLNAFIDASKALLDLGEELYEKATDIINSLGKNDNDEREESKLKEEREWR